MALPILEALPVHQCERWVLTPGTDRNVISVQIGDEPVVELGHFDFDRTKLVHEPLSSVALLVNRKSLTQNRILHHDIPALIVEPLREIPNLFQTVCLVIYR
jgi:hypothetical protein